jgi:hypothetical protein
MWPLDGIGKNIGSAAGPQAIESALSSLGEKMKGFDMAKLAAQIPVIAQIMPMWDGIKAGYNSMSPEQKAEMWKNLMIAGAKLAAKA